MKRKSRKAKVKHNKSKIAKVKQREKRFTDMQNFACSFLAKENQLLSLANYKEN